MLQTEYLYPPNVSVEALNSTVMLFEDGDFGK